MWFSTKYKLHTSVDLPKKAGVYIICEEKKISSLDFLLSKNIFYVGQTTNIFERMKQHLSSYEPNPLLNNLHINKSLSVFWHLLPINELKCVENELINILQPIANTVGIKKGKKNESYRTSV